MEISGSGYCKFQPAMGGVRFASAKVANGASALESRTFDGEVVAS